MRLIDADYVIEKLNEINGTTELDKAFEVVENAPTADALDKIRAEIEQLHYHPKLDYIKNDEVVDMALDVIDKYR